MLPNVSVDSLVESIVIYYCQKLTNMAPSLCGSAVQSRRNLLALGWTVVNILAFAAFVVALIFAFSAKNTVNYYYNNNNNNNNNQEENEEINITVSTRAMAFAALWTAVLAGIIGVFGSVTLGFQMPFGKYYWCCAGNVHMTTPLVLGSFIGSLIMFANLTLVCAVMFGEFEILDYREGEERDREDEEISNIAIGRSSTAFALLCIFLTVLYAGFGALTFSYSQSLLEENNADTRVEALMPSESVETPGYIGSDRFGVPGTSPGGNSTHGFVSPRQSQK